MLQGARRLVQTLTLAELLLEDAEARRSVANVSLHPSELKFRYPGVCASMRSPMPQRPSPCMILSMR